MLCITEPRDKNGLHQRGPQDKYLVLGVSRLKARAFLANFGYFRGFKPLGRGLDSLRIFMKHLFLSLLSLIILKLF